MGCVWGGVQAGEHHLGEISHFIEAHNLSNAFSQHGQTHDYQRPVRLNTVLCFLLKCDLFSSVLKLLCVFSVNVLPMFEFFFFFKRAWANKKFFH